MQFYHDVTTEKSFQLLQELRREIDFVLIGGWAVYLFTRSLKSKDIDFIIDYGALGKLKEKYEVAKNDRLKKYEIKHEGIDVDIYLPHYSDLGVPAESVVEAAREREGFILPGLEMLFLLKLYAYSARQGSLKGKKDELDIFSLAILPEFRWEFYADLVKEYDFESHHNLFVARLRQSRNIPELGVNEQKMAKFRKAILAKLEA